MSSLRLKIVLLLIAVLAVVRPPLQTEDAQAISGPATIVVNGKPLTFTQKDGFNIRRARLTDRYGRVVGRSHLICFTISKYERSCHGLYTFPRGSIRVAGPVLLSSYVLAVTGGTGLYNNVRGAMKVTPSGAQIRHRVFFQLVG
ncbi:MAG: hypothetical protein H0U53_00860 [Actinobacteria bacterium]|nr:hypothetical protein [Actinomycetota bacterium]